MKTTPLTEIHLGLGAKMAEFAGYNMPIEYSGIVDEHLCVCNKLGVFDVSHMGEIRVRGARSVDFLQYMLSNDIATLVDGKVQYSCLMNAQGGIVDDLLVYRFAHNDYLLVVNASNTGKDWDALCKHAPDFGLIPGQDIIDESADYVQLAVQGPLAMQAMQKLTATPILNMEYYTFKHMSFAGIEHVMLSATGYTGAGGCEIYAPIQTAATLWNMVLQAGKQFGIQPIGLGARDTLRLEMGYCLYGHELSDTTTPLEAGLGWITKFNKEFLGKAVLETQKADGVKTKLMAFVLQDKGVARHGYELCNQSGDCIGHVTSGTVSPLSRKSLGMGYVDKPDAVVGQQVWIRIRNKLTIAQLVKPPMR